MADLQCQECDHRWTTRRPLADLSDPKCGECNSRDFEVLERDERHSDDTLRKALKPLSLDNPEYVTQFFESTDDDAERLRDLMVDAGASPERAATAAEWYFRQTDREIDISDRRQAAAQHPGTTDPDEIATRAAQEVERRIKTDDHGQVDRDDESPPEAVKEARDKAVMQAAEKVESAGEKIERVSDAVVDLLIEAAREDPEVKDAIFNAFGVKTLAQLAANRENLLDKLTIESSDNKDSSHKSSEPPANALAGMMAGGSQAEQDETPADPGERTRRAAERAKQRDDDVPDPVTAEEGGESLDFADLTGDAGDDAETSDSDGEEIAEDFTEVA